MAPPPLSDLLDWRVPYVPLLAMICVSEDSAAEALEPGLRLPRSRFLPSPDGIANDDASRPMTTADTSTSGPLLRNSLRNMGWKPPCWLPFPRPTGCGAPRLRCHVSGCCAATRRAAERSANHREDRPRARHAAQLVRAAHLE